MKKDVFGRVVLLHSEAGPRVRRDATDAPRVLRWLARHLMAREARALAVLDGLEGVPALLCTDKNTLDRSYIDGVPMQVGRPRDVDYFRAASRVLRRIHRAGIVHNDLAKEPNFLVRSDGMPVIIDFQLSSFSRRRGRLFRALAHEDLRHLLKHKRTYCAERLTRREKAILDNPAIFSRIWMNTGKPVYLFITRKIFGWRDREGAGDR